MKRRLLTLCLAAACVCLLFAGCGQEEAEQEEGAYSIYYTNTEGTKLAAVSYRPKADIRPDAEGVETLADELLTKLATPPKETDTKVAMPVSVTVQEVHYEETADCLEVFFSESYREMDTITEVLCRAAYVCTLVQIPEVEYVEFFVGTEPLADASGKSLGRMSEDQFIDNTDEEFNAYQVGEVTLYFANEEGSRLVARTQEEIVGSNATERTVIEALIDGPAAGTEGAYATIPEGTRLLGVSTDNGICYVNLSEEFLVPRPDVTELVTLYSIVNSLCELDTVKQVQLAINGDSERTYIDDVTFSVPLEKKTDIIDPSTEE